jgi:hypothetical protein
MGDIARRTATLKCGAMRTGSIWRKVKFVEVDWGLSPKDFEAKYLTPKEFK